MAAERVVIQPEIDGWDKKVPCSFKNLQGDGAREIIYKNLIHYFKFTNFQTLFKETNGDEFLFECTRDEANTIRDNLHLILTSAHTNVWFTINTHPLHKLHEQLFSDTRTMRHQPSKVLFSFGSMYSTKLFYNHTNQFRYTGIIKVWTQGRRAVSLIITIRSLNKKITIPISHIQKTILVNKGHDDQPIQIILMLNSAVRIDENRVNDKTNIRIGNDDIPNSFTDVISKCSALLLQFDPPVNAWPFLLTLPIIGHADKNKRQDDNFQINFAPFTLENWSLEESIVKPICNSFKSHYAIEMLYSLGYLFIDKYMKFPNSEKSFIKMERDLGNDFYNLCCSIYNALKENHCLSLDELFKLHMPVIKTGDSTLIDMTPMNGQFIFIRQITLTPMRVIFNPLIRENGNRALRLRGAENYIRVYIREENGQTLDALSANIRSRLKRMFMDVGIRCMNRLYYCIGASTSQMKNYSYWFTVLHDGEKTVDQVRRQFGNFSTIKNVATYVARIGLYFSTSTATDIRLTYIDPTTMPIAMPQSVSPGSSLPFYTLWTQKVQSWFKSDTNKCIFQQKYTVFRIRDIKENGHNFTDGCGLISLGLAQEVSEKLGLTIKQLSDIPSVFQIRMSGCKGIVMIDPESKDEDHYIKIRDSMIKFPSNDWTLDICDYSRPMPLSLNNQVIRLLSDLENNLGIFESLQNRVSKPVLWHPPEETYLNVFDSELIDDQQARYLNVKENLLRNKIPLPIDEARNLFGVPDVTGKLEYGQCFIQYQTKIGEKITYKVVKGTVLVTKNPCLYPGDIQKLEAIDIPTLRHCIRDCIVFPTTGPRPHSDEISGSDLDGDQYWVYWGNDLKINKHIGPLPHLSAKKLETEQITNEIIIDYFLDTIESNSYSRIADVHTVIADKKGTLSKECIELATFFYRAIDSPKTGEIIDMDRVYKLKEEYCESFPKFMMKFDQANYESSSVNEKLYIKAKSMALKGKKFYERYQKTTNCQEKVCLSTALATQTKLEAGESSIPFYKLLPFIYSLFNR